LLGQLGALTSTDLGKIGLSSTPLFTELAAWMSGSVVIGAIIGLGFIFWSYAWLPGQILNASRNLLAYSLDGLMPGWLGRVDDRLHTPVNSLIVVGAASVAALAIYVFTPYFATLVGIFGFILSFILTSIAAIVFPYRKRDVFEGSPVAWRLAGLPVISIVGVLSLAACVLMEWDFLSDPLSGLGFSGQGLINLLVNIGIFLSGLAIYVIATNIQLHRGVDVAPAFAEIPVD
jgi:amino acid transporter